MITINLLNSNTRIPLYGRAVQLIFTDTVFGWMRLGPTNAEGITIANTYPGPARVYVDGELLDECWMEGEMKFLLKEGEDPEDEKGKEGPIREEEMPVHELIETQDEPTGKLTVVLPQQAASPPEVLTA